MQAAAFQMLDLAGENPLERAAETLNHRRIIIQIACARCRGAPWSGETIMSTISTELKTLSGEAERVSEWLRIKGSGANHVTRLESLGTLEQIELHGFTFVKGAVAVLLYGGEMHKHVLASGALNEPVPFSPVEPLHCTLLSHKKLLSLIAKNSFFPPLRSSDVPERPLKDVKNKVALPRAGDSAPKDQSSDFDTERNYGAKLGALETMARISTA